MSSKISCHPGPSDSTSDSTTSESDDGIVFPTGGSADKRTRTKKTSGGLSELERRRRTPLKRMRNSRSNPGLSPMSSSANLTERLNDRGSQNATLSATGLTGTTEAPNEGRPPIWCRSRSPKVPTNIPSSLVVDTGRTVEQVGLLRRCTYVVNLRWDDRAFL